MLSLGSGGGGDGMLGEIKGFYCDICMETQYVRGTEEKTEGETVDERFQQFIYLLVFYCHLAELSVVIVTTDHSKLNMG